MVDYEALETKIAEAGIKKNRIANELKISRQCLNSKLKGLSPLTVGECYALSRLLNLKRSEILSIFFAKHGDKMSRSEANT